MLMLGTDYQRYLTDPQAPFTVRLRFGSNGDSVVDIQTALIDKGYKLDVTGVFDVPTMRAVIDFQTKVLKHDNADGIVGKDTAAAMGVVLPEV